MLAVALPTLAADHRKIKTLVFDLDNLDSGAAAADFTGTKKRTMNLATAAAGTFGHIDEDHSAPILSIR